MTRQTAAGRRYENGVWSEAHDSLVVESPLEICINDRPFSITMRTPGDDEALVKGLLFTEGVVKQEGLTCRVETVPAPELPGATRASVEIPPVYVCRNLLEKRSLISNASCGLCGKQELGNIARADDALPAGPPLAVDGLPRMIAAMHDAQETFAATGGSHAAAAFTEAGELLRLFEDIGRHNAVDKVIGSLLDAGRLEDAHLLAVSGRISFEIVAKAYQAGIVFLAAVSAPSSMAVELGTRWGMSIIGFCREGRATVYSHPEQVV